MNIADAAGGIDQDLVVENGALQWYTNGPGEVVNTINYELTACEYEAGRVKSGAAWRPSSRLRTRPSRMTSVSRCRSRPWWCWRADGRRRHGVQ